MRIFSNLAITLDGKIAEAKYPNKSLGSPADKKLMEEIRHQADVVIMGAKTLSALNRCVRQKKRKTQIVNAVVTSQGNIPANSPFWSDPEVIRFVFTTEESYEKLLKRSKDRAFVIPTGKSKISLKKALLRLKESGLHNILVEGGGALMQAFLKEKLLQEIYLTLTPQIIGGTENPSLVGGVKALAPWPQLKLLKCQQLKNEVFFHYKVKGALKL